MKGFCKKIDLEPVETKQVQFTLSEEQLAYYNVSLHQWVKESGVYDILIGASAADIRLSGEIVCNEERPYTLNYEANK